MAAALPSHERTIPLAVAIRKTHATPNSSEGRYCRSGQNPLTRFKPKLRDGYSIRSDLGEAFESSVGFEASICVICLMAEER